MKKTILGSLLLSVFNFTNALSTTSSITNGTGIDLDWFNTVKVINNTPWDLKLEFRPIRASIDLGDCGGKTISNYSLDKLTASCNFNFTTYRDDLSLKNRGVFRVTMAEDPSSNCIIKYDYSYSYNPVDLTLSQFKKYSQNFKVLSCKGKLTQDMFSFDNPRIEAMVRQISGVAPISSIVVDKYKLDATIKLSHANCNGSKNCVVISPNLTSIYQTNGSSLATSLNLQAKLDYKEPLVRGQFLGGHNSIISPFYTQSKSKHNLNYADPDSFSTISQQLNAGVRMLEFDFGLYNGNIIVCHNHTNPSLSSELCDGNSAATELISELKIWLDSHPREFVLLYIEANSELNKAISGLDQALSQLGNRIYTPAEEGAYALNINQLTKDYLVNHLKKNIIIVTTSGDAFKASKYIFTSILGSQAKPLYSKGNSLIPNPDSNKYVAISKLYKEDIGHKNLLRTSTERTILGYIDSEINKNPYADFITPLNFRELLKYPLNVYALSMLGFASGNEDNTVTDPRFYSWLWSWSLGYPLTTGTNYAYINLTTGHFENQDFNQVKFALCETGVNLTSLEKSWQIVPIYNPLDLEQVNLACKQITGKFSVPTTSFYLYDVLQLARQKGVNENILINYHYLNSGSWQAN